MFRRAKTTARNFTVVDLMDNRAVHGIHTGQQSPILQLLLSSEENHDSDIRSFQLPSGTQDSFRTESSGF